MTNTASAVSVVSNSKKNQSIKMQFSTRSPTFSSSGQTMLFDRGSPIPASQNNRRLYVIGTPTTVRFQPFPTLLECRRCRRVHRLRDLTRRPNAQPRQCPECTGILGQLRYVQAHNCGRMEELYYPQNACPRHASRFLMFLDTGRVRSARWRCGACGDAEVGRLRMTPCTCQYSRSLGNQQGSIYERGLKTLA